MRRSDLIRQKPKQLSVDLGDGDSINLTFDANKITPAWMRDSQARDDENDSQSMPKALADVMISWDVTEDDGSAFPPTAENMAILPFPAQAALLREMLAAAIPSSEEGNASTNTLATPAAASISEPVSLPNGQEPSLSPAPSASPSPT